VEELERREVLSLNPGFAAGPFPVVPGTLSTPPAHFTELFGPTGLQPTQAFPDVRGSYVGPSVSPVTGQTDQFTLQVEQQANNGVFHPVTLPDRRGVSFMRIRQQLGNNFPWAALPDGRIVSMSSPQGQAGNNFQGTVTIAGLGVTFTVLGTFGRHGLFRAAGVDGQHVLLLRGTFLKNQDGTSTVLLRYRLQTAPGQVDHGTANLTGTPGAAPTLPTPLF
jgi:hypothetical protein